jgi:hypothetical protein
VSNPSGVIAWGVSGLYLLVIAATLGRPLLVMSDLLEEKEDDEGFQYPDGLWRRSRVGQVIVLTGIVGGLFIAFYL